MTCRIWETSISMCIWAGVPGVRTMWSASAASRTSPVSRRATGLKNPLEHLLGPGLLEGHAPGLDGFDRRRHTLDADHVQAAIGERQREWQPDSAQSNNGNARHRHDPISLRPKLQREFTR